MPAQKAGARIDRADRSGLTGSMAPRRNPACANGIQG
jgi:hypothetical protein